MNIGILGTGFGAYHAETYKKLNNINRIIIFGRDTEKLNAIKKELNIETTDDINDIITNREIDLVDICLPVALHREHAIEALKNGKDVFCETPVCHSIEDALAIKEAQNKYNKRMLVNNFIKHEYPYEYVYETIKTNALGKLTALHVRRKTPPMWGDMSLNHITTNLMIHELDFVTWLLGEPEKVSSFGINGNEGQAHVDVQLLYKDTIAEIQCSSMMPEYHPFTVGYEAIFEKGTIEYNENGYVDKTESSFVLYTNEERRELEPSNKNCYVESIRDVIECCNKGKPTRLSLDAAVRSLKVALQIKDEVLKGR